MSVDKIVDLSPEKKERKPLPVLHFNDINAETLAQSGFQDLTSVKPFIVLTFDFG